MPFVSPSVLGVDYLELKEILKTLENAKTDLLHLDVMDGNFVPNISFGVPVIKSVKKHTSIKLDVHLMIDKPERYIEDFAKYADYLSFHYEATDCAEKILKKIRSLGVKSALAIKPKTEPEEIFHLLPFCDMVLVMSVEPGFGGQKFMPSAAEKIAKLKKEITARRLDTLIEVDGGINAETAAVCAENGVDVLVAGSFLFNSENIAKTVNLLKNTNN